MERRREPRPGKDIWLPFDVDYLDFLKTKIEIAPESGFDVDHEKINQALKPHQRDAVSWALKGGRRALFESFGLGKTIQELEFCRLAAERTGGKALIVLPLGVKQEFTRDAVELLGYEKPEYCRTMEEIRECSSQIILTNYERVRDGDIDPTYFAATSLDEASVLRSFGSKTYQTFLDKFKGVPYKLVATATPSPNRYKELIHYAGYLEIMDTGQALTRFFQRDSTKANNLTLYPNMEDEFWLWVSSWALFITKPSDLDPAYSDEGYVLPPLDVRWHEIPVHYGDATDKDGQMSLFTDAAAGLKQAAEVKRNTIGIRKYIVENPDPYIVKDGEKLFLSYLDKAYISAFLIKYYGSGGSCQGVDRPLDTITTKDRFGLVNVVLEIEGEQYILKDIFLRMLKPEELKLMQGFPRDYIINRDYNWKSYPIAKQVARIGNSVVPIMAQKLVEANCPYLKIGERLPNFKTEEENTGQIKFA